MATPVRLSSVPPRRLQEQRSLAELEALPNGSRELEQPLPAWVTEAHLRWLETGEGDPWGGYFS